MADTTNPLPSITEPVIDRNRRWSPIWYRWIKPLLETVKSLDGMVQETIDNIAGKWTLSVNVDNRIVGAITIDGSQSESVVAILADKFIIVRPGVDAETIQAFIVGSVDGVTTVGINGDLLVDGTIVARHLDVESLSAIAVDAGEITAGILRSADGNMVIDLDNKSIVMEV